MSHGPHPSDAGSGDQRPALTSAIGDYRTGALGRRAFLAKVAGLGITSAAAYQMLAGNHAAALRGQPEATTQALGEEQPQPPQPPPTTEALGEEHLGSTQALGEEDVITTQALGEEDVITTQAIGEEGPRPPQLPPQPSPTVGPTVVPPKPEPRRWWDRFEWFFSQRRRRRGRYVTNRFWRGTRRR